MRSEAMASRIERWTMRFDGVLLLREMHTHNHRCGCAVLTAICSTTSVAAFDELHQATPPLSH